MRSLTAEAQLRTDISSGRYEPGYKLNESALSEELGISRNTLRECFATLANQGLVTRIPHRGVFITSPTLRQVEDFYAARILLEPAALRIGELDVTALDSIVHSAETALQQGDYLSIAGRIRTSTAKLSLQ